MKVEMAPEKEGTPSFSKAASVPQNAPSEPRGVSLARAEGQNSKSVKVELTEAERKFADAMLSGRLGLPELGDGSRYWNWMVRLGASAGLGEAAVKAVCWHFWSHRGDAGECPFGECELRRVSRCKAVRRLRDWGSGLGLCLGRIADADEVLERYTEVMRDGLEKSSDRLTAMKALGTKLGLFKEDGAKGSGKVTIVLVNPYGSAPPVGETRGEAIDV